MGYAAKQTAPSVALAINPPSSGDGESVSTKKPRELGNSDSRAVGFSAYVGLILCTRLPCGISVWHFMARMRGQQGR